MSNTFMRVGTANMYDNALRNLGERHSSLVGLQDNLTSGKRVVRPSDDPVAAAQAERAQTRLARVQTDQRALETQRNAIAQAESTLGDAVGLVQELAHLGLLAPGAAQQLLVEAPQRRLQHRLDPTLDVLGQFDEVGPLFQFDQPLHHHVDGVPAESGKSAGRVGRHDGLDA